MPCPPEVLQLIQRFEDHRDEYRLPEYKETQLRREFLDPLFKALGWDIDNVQGHAEAYKEVIHEDAIKIGGESKAPDYCFRVGGTRKFFLEAKKPAVNIKEDASPAYQLRRYAWSAKLPLSVLSDFEETAVYDCRVKPDHRDKASTARVLLIRYDELAARWDEFAGIFSREAVLKGSFDKFAESNKKKRGTAQVDAAFLADIEGWRNELAKNLALRNADLETRDLNFAVQRIIDRIIFLRIAEDRGIEDYGQLQALLNGTAVYRRLAEMFRAADDRYNSGIFHFEKEKDRPEPPDELTLGLELDDKVLKEIIRGLYYPDSPYEFSVLSADILGQVYEQFLGKVITLTTGHRAVVEDKPEVKKAGGVYYTPTYIVDYIVRQTVGKLLEGKTPKQAAKLKILDPACGSGSFLIGAYQFLLDWHLAWYVADGPEKHVKVLYQAGARAPLSPRGRGAGGEGATVDPGAYRLTIAERKRILLNNIYGVDIDPQAVEVTKLSLLLKVLEGASREVIERQRRLFHERALPDLALNIKCGNSLIGPDFYDGQQMHLFDEEERYRINAFDWRGKDGFPEIMKAGGFDAVIGNPPWGQKEISKDLATIQYLRAQFSSLGGIFDLFRPFVDRGIDFVRDEGLFGMVLPDIVLLKDYPDTRRLMLERLTLTEIDWWGMAFTNAVIDATTIVGRKSSAPSDHAVNATIHDPDQPLTHRINQLDFWDNREYTFNLFLTPEKKALLAQLKKNPTLGEFFEIHEGVHSGNIREEIFVDRKIDATCRKLYFGRDEISPHSLQWNGAWINLGAVPKKRTKARYANVGQTHWHEQPKVLVRRTGDYVLAAADEDGFYASNNFFVVFPKQTHDLDLNGLCALLNSRFMTWFFRTVEPRTGRVFAELKIKHLELFPLPIFTSRKQQCERLNAIGKQRREIVERLSLCKTPHQKAVLARECESIDRQIDDAVLTALDLDKSFSTHFLNGNPNGQTPISHNTSIADTSLPHR